MATREDVVKKLRREAKKKVHGPATIMLVLASLGFLFSVLVLMLGVGGVIAPPPTADGNIRARSAAFIFVGCIALPTYLYIAAGAYQMDKLGNFRMASISSTLAVIPMHPVWPLFLIGGLVAKSTLNNPRVRAAFAKGNGDALERLLEMMERPSQVSGESQPRPQAKRAVVQDEGDSIE